MTQLRHAPAVAGHGKRDMFFADVRKLKPQPGFNLRDMESEETKAHIAELKAQIIGPDPKNPTGIKVPMEIDFDGTTIWIRAGHCRVAAAMQAIAEGIEIPPAPVIQEEKGTTPVQRTVNQIIGNNGLPLDPLAKARGVELLAREGQSAAAIAGLLGWRDTQQVDNMIRLLASAPEVLEMVKNNEVSPSLAVSVTRKDGKTGAVTVLKRAKEIAKKRGKKKITAKTVKAARGELDLSKRQIKHLVATLRHIAKRSKDAGSKRTATLALEHVGLSAA